MADTNPQSQFNKRKEVILRGLIHSKDKGDETYSWIHECQDGDECGDDASVVREDGRTREQSHWCRKYHERMVINEDKANDAAGQRKQKTGNSGAAPQAPRSARCVEVGKSHFHQKRANFSKVKTPQMREDGIPQHLSDIAEGGKVKNGVNGCDYFQDKGGQGTHGCCGDGHDCTGEGAEKGGEVGEGGSLDGKKKPCKPDKSIKGSIDLYLQPLCRFLNSHPSFITTSCCSGRTVVFEPGGWEPRSLLVSSSSSLSSSSASESPDILAKAKKTKKSAKLLFVNHLVIEDPITVPPFFDASESCHAEGEDGDLLLHTNTKLRDAMHSRGEKDDERKADIKELISSAISRRLGEIAQTPCSLPATINMTCHLHRDYNASNGLLISGSGDSVGKAGGLGGQIGDLNGTSCDPSLQIDDGLQEGDNVDISTPKGRTTQATSDDFQQVTEKSMNGPENLPSSSSLSVAISLKFEPVILHIECDGLESAKKILSLSLESGLRQSGIISAEKRFIVAVRGSNRLELPIYQISLLGVQHLSQSIDASSSSSPGVNSSASLSSSGPLASSSASPSSPSSSPLASSSAPFSLLSSSNPPVDVVGRWLVSDSYLRIVLDLCNEKMRQNLSQINRFYETLQMKLHFPLTKSQLPLTSPLTRKPKTTTIPCNDDLDLHPNDRDRCKREKPRSKKEQRLAGKNDLERNPIPQLNTVLDSRMVESREKSKEIRYEDSGVRSSLLHTAKEGSENVKPVNVEQSDDFYDGYGANGAVEASWVWKDVLAEPIPSLTRQSLCQFGSDKAGMDLSETLSRWGAAVAYEDPFLCIFGGFIKGRRIASLCVYNCIKKKWMIKEYGLVKDHHSSITDGDHDTKCNHKSIVDSGGNDIAGHDKENPGPLFGASLISLGSGLLFLFGGRTSPTKKNNLSWILNTKDWRWKQIQLRADPETKFKNECGVSACDDLAVGREVENIKNQFLVPQGRWRHAMCLGSCHGEDKSKGMKIKGDGDDVDGSDQLRFDLFLSGGVFAAQPIHESVLGDLWRLRLSVKVKDNSHSYSHHTDIEANGVWKLLYDCNKYNDPKCENEVIYQKDEDKEAHSRRCNPAHRHSHTMCTFPGSQHRILLLGGLTNQIDSICHPEGLESVWCFDTIKEMWSRIHIQGDVTSSPIEWPVPRFSHVTTLMNSYGMLLLGGCDGTCRAPDDIWLLKANEKATVQSSETFSSYHPSLAWQKIGKLPPQNLRFRCGSAWARSKLMVVGGGCICFTFGSHFDQPVCGFLKKLEPAAAGKKKQILNVNCKTRRLPGRQSSKSVANSKTRDSKVFKMPLDENSFGQSQVHGKDDSSCIEEGLYVAVLRLEDVKPSKMWLEAHSVFDKKRKIITDDEKLSEAMRSIALEPHLVLREPQSIVALLPVTSTFVITPGAKKFRFRRFPILWNFDGPDGFGSSCGIMNDDSDLERSQFQDSESALGTTPEKMDEYKLTRLSGTATKHGAFLAGQYQFTEKEVLKKEGLRIVFFALSVKKDHGSGKEKTKAALVNGIILEAKRRMTELAMEILKHRLNIQENCSLARGATKNLKFERLGDIILLPSDTFDDLYEILSKIKQEVQLGRQEESCIVNADRIAEVMLQQVSQILGVRAIGCQAPIEGPMRRGQVKILYGGSPRTVHRENGVDYVIDVTRCMFASGNGIERGRIARLILEGDPSHETVVDMFCGIGYFTLPILKKTSERQVQKVYACDWNSEAQKFLQQAAVKNSVDCRRLAIISGDSRDLGLAHGPDHGSLKSQADRLILGLIPTSLVAWPASVRLLNKTRGGFFHIHGVATMDRSLDAKKETIIEIKKSIDKMKPGSSTQMTPEDVAHLTTDCDEELTEGGVPYSCRDAQSPDIPKLEKAPRKGNVDHDLSFAQFVLSHYSILLRDELICHSQVQEGNALSLKISSRWRLKIVNVECVKSYAPKRFHFVVDLHARPCSCDSDNCTCKKA